MPSDAVLTTLITALAGVITGYIAYRIKNTRPKSKDRVDTAFDMYEAIVKRQDKEIEGLREENARLIAENGKLRAERRDA